MVLVVAEHRWQKRPLDYLKGASRFFRAKTIAE